MAEARKDLWRKCVSVPLKSLIEGRGKRMGVELGRQLGIFPRALKREHRSWR